VTASLKKAKMATATRRSTTTTCGTNYGNAATKSVKMVGVLKEEEKANTAPERIELVLHGRGMNIGNHETQPTF